MKLRYKMILLFMSLISILSIVTGVYSITTMKDKIIGSAQSKLLSDLALSRTLIDSRYPGSWSIRDNQIYKGDFCFNNQFDFVDEIGELTGDTFTIFQNDTRVATNVIQEDGNRAIYTKVSDEVRSKVLDGGETYIGKANVVGTWNQTVYEPILDANHKAIGILYVGVPNTLYDEMANNFRSNLIVLIIVGILVFSVIVWVICSKMFNPLTKLEQVTEKMATGDLTTKININTRDELGVLASAFNTMQDNFNRVLGNISIASAEVNSGSKEVSDSSMALSQGATEQASAIEELTVQIEDISHQMKLNSDNTEKANHLTSIVNTNAMEGSTNMENLQTAMEKINQTSHDISKIIKVIDNIAFQTNILSLNASVEAAQSGKYGRGFAVVAEEVRNLAVKSALAAKDSSELINNSLNKVEEGMILVDANAKFLKEILSGIREIANAINNISIATKEQSISIEQVSLGISQVAAVTQNTSTISEEALATSEELFKQVEALEKQVKQFTLG